MRLWPLRMPTQTSFLTIVWSRFWSWGLVTTLKFGQDFEVYFGQTLRLRFGHDFEAEVWSRFWGRSDIKKIGADKAPTQSRIFHPGISGTGERKRNAVSYCMQEERQWDLGFQNNKSQVNVWFWLIDWFLLTSLNWWLLVHVEFGLL